MRPHQNWAIWRGRTTSLFNEDHIQCSVFLLLFVVFCYGTLSFVVGISNMLKSKGLPLISPDGAAPYRARKVTLLAALRPLHKVR